MPSPLGIHEEAENNTHIRILFLEGESRFKFHMLRLQVWEKPIFDGENFPRLLLWLRNKRGNSNIYSEFRRRGKTSERI